MIKLLNQETKLTIASINEHDISFKLHQERIQTIPHNDCEVKSLARDQSRAFQDENIFKRNFKVIQSDPFSKGFIVIKDVRKI